MRYYLLPLLVLCCFGCREKRLFNRISSDHSGVHFNNNIVENDSINPLDVTNIYNGGGVGIGDFNNDGLQDLYFAGNTVSNKLYLNKGEWRFEDVTNIAKVTGEGKWSRGVAVVDINADGWLDIYVCCTIHNDARQRENLLYVNQGRDESGIPIFKNMAAAYGLNDTTHSTMAAFFDYDNDSDLDMYLVVNEIAKDENPNQYRHAYRNGEHHSTGRLYRNVHNDSLGHPYFTNVSKEAGVTIEGFGHSANIADINNDGWKDIYVANDFIPDNTLYINNQDGTFTNKVKEYFKHTTANTMGQDITDINNDGLQDIIEVDMNPEDNYRKKTMMNGNNYRSYQNIEEYGYQYQYVRNMIQLNRGQRIGPSDSIGEPVFSDIGYYSGISATDWSWAPVVTDFDNDGFRDIIITNGYPKDVTDHDFMAFRKQANNLIPKAEMLQQIPIVKIPNYAFRNNGDLTFNDVSVEWGLAIPSFSNGAAYADLDNDGDMDFVINNINDEAFLYENTLSKGNDNDGHYLQVRLVGDSANRNGLGAWIEIIYDGKRQVYEQTPYRGYLSSVQLNPHFGLDSVTLVDTLTIRWPDGKQQAITGVAADQVLTLDKNKAAWVDPPARPAIATHTFFTDITSQSGIHYRHEEKDFIDFNLQKLLPHKLSEYGPALAAGDIDGNGLDDFIVGGSAFYSPMIFLQQGNGQFLKKALIGDDLLKSKKWEEMGIALFDADNDGDLDIYTASGGYENKPNSDAYRDKLYVNDGKGGFVADTVALPENLASKSCVRVTDFDKDGDLDIFLGGRVEPGNYPKPVSSFIFRNDSREGRVRFTDVTKDVAKDLLNIGLVCDAVWTDFNNDGWMDLAIAGEWMPLTFLENKRGRFDRKLQVLHSAGWWTSIVPGDFDNDGDTDYIAGNTGENTFYNGSVEYPVRIYGKDFDNNGILECIPTRFLKGKDGRLHEFPAHTRDDVVDQMPFIKKKYLTYKAFAEASITDIFSSEQLQNAIRLEAVFFQSVFIRNNNQAGFEMLPLPAEAQLSCINGMVAEDFDDDGNLDLLMTGNDFGTDISVGRYDAGNGLLLKGDGNGGFHSLPILTSGFFVPGNAKALVRLRSAEKKLLLAASQNRGPLKIFTDRQKKFWIPVEPMDEVALVTFSDGRQQRRELNYGASFLSQSSRFLAVSSGAVSVSLQNSRGEKRNVKL